jgi:hypothetical protein
LVSAKPARFLPGARGRKRRSEEVKKPMSISFTRRQGNVRFPLGDHEPGWSVYDWQVESEGRTVIVTEITTPSASKALFSTEEPVESVADILEACRQRWPDLHRWNSDIKRESEGDVP